MVKLLATLSLVLLLADCGAAGHPDATTVPRALLLQARPIGRGAAFHPPASGSVLGRCRAHLGPRLGVHVEVFAQNRVVLVPAGLGTQPPLQFSSGRIAGARCYGDVVTLEPTGLVLVRPAARAGLAAMFRSWGQPISGTRVASFSAPRGGRVSVYVNGRRWTRAPGEVPLRRHTEIVVEVGPHVPPHPSYTFPPGT